MTKFNHIRGKFYEIDAAEIYFEEIGNPDGQPIVFLHGGFGNIEDFNGIIPLLKGQYRIIGVDSRGQGKSTLGESELTYSRLEIDVEHILKHLNLNNPIIIGFSDGGITALRIACSKKIKVKQLIVIGASWHSKDLEESKVFLESITPKKWKEKFPETYENYQRLNPSPDFNKITENIVNMWIDEESTGHPNECVENIDCPTLIVRGDKDHLCSLQSSCELKEKVKDSDFANVPFCGHEVYAEKPKLLMNIINEFLMKTNANNGLPVS